MSFGGGTDTYVSYAGYQLELVKTNSFRQETIYSDDGVDKVYTKITLNVNGILNTCLQGQDPATWIASVRESMLLPRRELVVQFGGSEILRSPFPGLTEDAKHGPRPLQFNIQRYDGTTAFIQFEIETFIEECSEIPAVLSHRWDCSYSIDNDYYSTRIINGTVILNSEIAGLDLKSLQPLIIPMIASGWKRESIQIAVQSDGLKLNYTITDKERHLAVPKYVVDWSARYTQTLGIDQHLSNNEISVVVKGEPHAPVGELLKVAARLVFSRINPNATTARTTSEVKEFLTSFSVTEDIGRNTIEMRVTTKSAKTIQVDEQSNMLFTRIGAEIDIDEIKQNTPRVPDGTVLPIKGNYLALLFAATVQDPCYVSGITSAAPVYATQPSTKEIKISVTQTNSLNTYDQTNTNYTNTQVKLPYTDYEIDVVYPNAYNVLQLPTCYSSGMTDYSQRCNIVKVGCITGSKEIHWRAERIGQRPDMPDPENYTTGSYLTGTKVHLGAVELAPDGVTRKYITSGVYTYALDYPTNYKQNSGIEVAANPYVLDTFEDNKLDGTKYFKTGIIGSGTNPGTEI